MKINYIYDSFARKILYFMIITSLIWLSFFHDGIVQKMFSHDIERSGHILGKMLSYVFIMAFILAYFKKFKSKKQAFLIMLVCLNLGYMLVISKVIKL